MDILTPKGQETLKQEQRALEILNREHIQTPKNLPADIDGFFTLDGEIVAGYEVKCRTSTEEEFKRYGSWLVTFDKVQRCANISKALCIDIYGIVYLVPDDVIYLFKMTNKEGAQLFDYCDYTTTQATVNGGKANRYNAFYNIKQSTVVVRS